VTDSLLQANVMLSYPLDEALELLQRNLDGAQSSLENVMDDLDFLRDQITTMEVRVPRSQPRRLPTDRL
jgi:prefoldin subunit 5